jgi:hypothetical protein
MTCIEAKLARQPDLVHYRVAVRSPRLQVLKDHLQHLLQIRQAASRLTDDNTLFIGLFEDYRREPDNFICANEKRVFIRLPSMNGGLQKYDTGIELQGRVAASHYVRLVQEFYCASRPVESEQQVEVLAIVDSDQAAIPGI